MKMNEQRSIPAPRDQVCQALNGPEILKAAMPGCDVFEATDDNEYLAQLVAKVGPVRQNSNSGLPLMM